MTLTLEQISFEDAQKILADTLVYAPMRRDGLDVNLRQLNPLDAEAFASRGHSFAHVLARYGYRVKEATL